MQCSLNNYEDYTKVKLITEIGRSRVEGTWSLSVHFFATSVSL